MHIKKKFCEKKKSGAVKKKRKKRRKESINKQEKRKEKILKNFEWGGQKRERKLCTEPKRFL